MPVVTENCEDKYLILGTACLDSTFKLDLEFES